MKFRWEDDMSVTLGTFLVGTFLSYVVFSGVDADFSTLRTLRIIPLSAMGGAYLGITAWILMFIAENIKKEE